MKKLSNFHSADAAYQNYEAVLSLPISDDRYRYLVNEVERFRSKLCHLKHERNKI